MKGIHKTIALLLLFSTAFVKLASCTSNEKEKPAYFDAEIEFDDNSMENEPTTIESTVYAETVTVPFTECDGVKMIEVKINQAIGVNMILDSGCSSALISIDEANYLYNKGVLSVNDFEGIAKSQVADGRIVENMVVNLRELEIGGRIVCPNVRAVVSDNHKAALLLGNEVLNRTASYEVDNTNKVIIFRLN